MIRDMAGLVSIEGGLAILFISARLLFRCILSGLKGPRLGLRDMGVATPLLVRSPSGCLDSADILNFWEVLGTSQLLCFVACR